IWHSTILRPGDNGYYKQEDLEQEFDQPLSLARFIREELGITHKKYDSLDDFFTKLDESIPLREKLKIEVEEVPEQEYKRVRNIISKDLIGRKKAQSAIECSTFLYFNKYKSYSRNEIYFAIEENLDLSGLTPRRTFNSDIGRYTTEVVAKKKSKPQLFTITDIIEKEHKIQLIPEVRTQIGMLLGKSIKQVEQYKKRFWIFQSNPEKFDLEKAIRELEKDVFLVNQYKSEIRKGDKILFWISGVDAGIIGYGDVLTNPKVLEQNPEALKYVKNDDFNEKLLRVWVSYNEIKPKILKLDLQEYYPDITEKMSIFKNPRGTNFPIDKEVMDFFKKNFIETSYSETITSFDPGLNKGQVINNTELMEIFKVSNSGGMRRSYRTNSLVLISDHTKGLYGDRWEDEILHYTGMGLMGDQSLEYMQNKTLHESNSNRVNIFLFEVFNPREYTYRGGIKLISEPYQEDQPDKEGNFRKVWIFPLKLITEADIDSGKDGFKESEIQFPSRKKLDINLLDHEEIENVKDLLLNYKQIILYGPPGTGKTYFAQILAQEIAENHYEIIQFHPSYSYEDFVEWIEAVPTTDGKGINFKPKARIFRILCEEASNQPNQNFVLIIDEINRGDLGRIFGELILGLEPSNRTLEINTPLSKSLGKLRIPENLYIIGTMNSVDRSIAIVDYALRRRFLFYLMMPNFEILEKWVNLLELNLTGDVKNKILNLFNNLNNKIRGDRKLSKHHQVGHTYFFVNSEEELIIRWEHMIKPLMEEYYNFNEDDLSDYNYDELIGV
ncbi:MAG: AAA family ATPase, partial [Candidatus Odinarchaeota archaeon]